MGCPCREIRRAIAHLPGGRALIGLLPELPRSKGPTMRMQTTPGQRIMTIAGHHYAADAAGFINDVDPADASELQRVGCRPLGESVLSPVGIAQAALAPEVVGLAVPVELAAPPAAELPVGTVQDVIDLPAEPTGFGLAVKPVAEEALDPAAAGHHEAPERSE
jgi:hypothetical protein